MARDEKETHSGPQGLFCCSSSDSVAQTFCSQSSPEEKAGGYEPDGDQNMEDLTEKCKISNTVKFGQVFSVLGPKDPHLGTGPLRKVEMGLWGW